MKLSAGNLLRGVAGLAGAFVVWLFAVWPPPAWYRTHWPAETAFQEMRRKQERADGRTVGRSDGRTPVSGHASMRPPARLYHPVPLDSIAPSMVDAAMAGEDQRFLEHHGIDWVNLRRALGYDRDDFRWGSSRDRRDLLRALPHAWARRDRLRGASTITQQLAKNLYLSPSRNPLRKVKEAVTAWRLEAALDKDRIMELYLNTVELGHEVWGVDAASRLYFKHPARQLTLAESAELAGELPFPLRSNPGYRPARMFHRQQLILAHLRGEQVEIPPDSGLVDVPDTIVPAPTVESLPPMPPESLQLLPVPDSGGAGQRDSVDQAPPRHCASAARLPECWRLCVSTCGRSLTCLTGPDLGLLAGVGLST
ncbi:MAG TPA: biosynthetic peptidoglycan transglycosylase [Gemmatimonadales bacterium]|nr:biosynthetic peptidoglycan transglycosylase [Gemmatimonadales bacterium]